MTKEPLAGDFPGFSEEAFKFLKSLAKNNDREWFLPRKSTFEKHLLEPMMRLVLAVENELKKNKIPLQTKAKAPLSRIYRDIRFSADKSPYHTHVSATLHRNGKKDSPGVLYIHIGEKEQFAAAGFWQPDRPILTNWRLRIQEEPKIFLNMIKKLAGKKLSLDQNHRLHRMPRGFEAAENSPIGESLRFQSFVIMQPLSKAEAMSPNLPQTISRFAMDALPLLEYGWAIPQTKSSIFLD